MMELWNKLSGMMSQGADKCMSRKFWVLAAATTATCMGMLTGQQWMMVAMAYLGAQGLTDAMDKKG